MIVKTIETMFRAMSDAERLATVAMITEVCKELGHTLPESSTTPKKSGLKRKPRGVSSKTYWMRTAKAIDMSKKGMFQIEGEWVNNLAKDTEMGELVVLGVKGDEKEYHLVTRSTSGEFSFDDSAGNKVVIENCEHLYDTKRYSDLITEVKDQLHHV